MKWFVWPEERELALSGLEFARAIHWIRHGFLNDLQVLSGWLQLGRPKAAAEYLERVQSRLGEWAVLGDPDLEAVLLLVKAEAEGVGLVFRTEVTGLGGRDRVSTASFVVASLAMLRAVIRMVTTSAAATRRDAHPDRLEATLGLTDGRLELGVRLPELDGFRAADWARLEDEPLKTAGFVPCEAGGIVGIEWRPGAARPVRSELARVAEGAPPYHSLVLVAGGYQAADEQLSRG